jgi:integrase
MYNLVQLQDIRSTVLENAKMKCGFDTVLFLSMLSNTGMRSNELEKLKDAVNVSQNIYTFPTSKHGDNRTFDFDLLGEYVEEIRQGRYKDVFPKCVQSYQNDFHKCLPVGSLKVGNKDISLHLYRHIRIKELFYRGWTIAQIKTYLGLKNVLTVTGYVNSIVY